METAARTGGAVSSSFAGSETITNQILQERLRRLRYSIERDAQRLRDGGFVIADWLLPSRWDHKQTFVIIVRQGNPAISDFPDLAKPEFGLSIPTQ